MRRSTNMKYFAAAFALVLATSFMTGCGQKIAEKVSEEITEKAIESAAEKQGQKVDVDISSGKMTVKSDEGTVEYDAEKGTSVMRTETGETVFATGEKAEIPADFPKDVPLYTNMKPNLVGRDESEKTITVSATSPDPSDKITSFYRDGMKKQGWAEETSLTQDMGKMNLFTFTKGEREATLMIMAGEKTSEITLTVNQ